MYQLEHYFGLCLASLYSLEGTGDVENVQEEEGREGGGEGEEEGREEEGREEEGREEEGREEEGTNNKLHVMNP